ncbi:MAG: twin-arginine translocase TatA/TatE family subunit [Candidatus Thermoplasmatota archaeon]|nr:twin-arginine translocase TatA/TatE family subunit [Candidatus Thermoplasmatota archaeon]MEC8107082.1 twin-arginine translocase TatA/TatE family subunit [Candidatus Thermoplasmatota archaeon]
MAFSPGPLEIIILLGIFFILFGAERLPKMANALGRSKGEFHKGLNEATTVATITDLEAGGKTPDQVLMDRAKAVGIDPTGMALDELEKKVAALESLSDEE